MGGATQPIQDAMQAAQVAGGAAMTATGNPTMGVPMMVGGMQAATTPPPQPGQPATPSPLASLNPQMLSQMMGGQKQQQQQPPPQAPPRPPMNMQNAGQQAAVPQAQPAPKPPTPPQPPQAGGQQSIQAILQKLLGGSA